MAIKWTLLAGAALLALAGCGGGGGGDPAPAPALTNEVPDAALASSAALVDWGKALPASDSADPLDLRQATLPASDTEEPRAL